LAAYRGVRWRLQWTRCQQTSRPFAETLRDLRLVHEHRAFGVSDLIDDKSELEEAMCTFQRLRLRLLGGPAPLILAGTTMHVPPNCPIQTRPPVLAA
jgi:hypothetical protein